MKKAFLLVFSMVVLYVIIEIFFLAFYPHSQYSVTFAPWGWKHIANTKVQFYGEHPKLQFNLKLRPKPVTIKYNSKGLRSPEHNYHKYFNFCDTFYQFTRVMLIGDSWTEDMGSPMDNLHSTYLRKKLNYEYKPVGLSPIQVINAGH